MGKVIKMPVYHGTTEENAKKIMQCKCFNSSSRQNEWLGHGAYFFAHESDARWWISHDRFSNQKTVVLECELEYLSSEILDLDDAETIQNMNILVQEALKRKNKGIDLSTFTIEQAQCFYCNFIQNLKKDIKVRSYTFARKNSMVNCFGFRLHQRQICVVDLTVIKSVNGEKWR